MPVTLPIVAAFLLYPAVDARPVLTALGCRVVDPLPVPHLMTFWYCGWQTPPFWQIAPLAGRSAWATTVGGGVCRRQDLPGGHLDVRQKTSLVELLRWLKYTVDR